MPKVKLKLKVSSQNKLPRHKGHFYTTKMYYQQRYKPLQVLAPLPCLADKTIYRQVKLVLVNAEKKGLSRKTLNYTLSPAVVEAAGQEQLQLMSFHHGLKMSQKCLQT